MKKTGKTKKLIALFAALALTLTALTSCSAVSDAFDFLYDALTNGGVRVLGDFNDLTYEKPDFDAIDNDIDELKSALAEGKKTKSYYIDRLSEIIGKYYYDALTMENLAFLRYCNDITDASLREEYYTLISESKKTAAKLEELYSVCAASEYKADFEEQCFGKGFLDSYSGDIIEYPPEYTALRGKEAALMSEYSAAMSELTVEYDGKTYTSADISAVEDEELYNRLVSAYYTKFNPTLAEIYVKLVGVRNEIAVMLGYGSCTDYSFDSYSREYSGDDLKAYFSGIKEHIVPLYRKISDDITSGGPLPFPYASPDRVKSLGKELAGKMSPKLGRIFGSMEKKHLVTVGSSDKMYYGSFQIYLNSCDSPYIFVNGEGSEYDVLTLMHEFGHFTSAYYNHGSTGGNDEAEVASSALELLTLKYADGVFDSETAASIGKSGILSIISSLVECAAYSEFENLVYSDKALTAEKCNGYFRQVAEEYGISGGDSGYLYWVMVNHLFEYPYYVAGYSVSADVALQIYESCDGSIDPYLDFIKLARSGSFSDNIKTAGLESPFSEGRAEKAAAVIQKLTEKYFS